MKPVGKFMRAAVAALTMSFAGVASAIDIMEDTEWSTADAQSHASEAIAISEGVALTVNLADAADAVALSGVISGEGALKLTGAGSLTLSGANTYAGGFYLTGDKTTATVFGETATAFGSGTVHVDARGWVCLKVAANTTFANAFDFTDAGFLCCMPTAKAQFTLTGAITASQHFFVANSYKGGNTYAALSSKITFTNTITAPGYYLTFVGNHGAWYTSVHFENTIVAGGVRNLNLGWGGAPDSWASGMGNGACPTYFYSAANDIGIVAPYGNGRAYILSGNGVFGANATLTSADKRHDGYHHGAAINLGKNDQTVSSIALLDTYNYKYNVGCPLSSDSAMTLTVTGGGSYTTDWLLKDSVSLNWNPPNDGDELALSNQTHTTSGKITVTKGAVNAGGANVSLKNLTAIDAYGAFRLATPVATPLSALETLTIGSSGRFELADGMGTPFDTMRAEPPSLTIATGGKIRVPAGCLLTFKNVTVGGALQAFKTFNKDNCDWIEGDGSVKNVGFLVLDKAAIDAFAADSLDTTDTVVTFALAGEETATWAKPITGNGTVNVAGTGGTLTFADVKGTFTGTASIKGKTNVEILGPDVFGTGTIEFDYENAKTDTDDAYYGLWTRPAVYFNGSYTVKNPLHVTKNAVIGFKGGEITVASDLTATSTFKLRVKSNYAVNWRGDIEAPGCEVIMLGNSFRGTSKFYGNVRADKFYGYCPDWAGGGYYIYGTTDVGMISSSMGNFYAAAPGLFGEQTVLQTHYSVLYHRLNGGGWIKLWYDTTVDHCETPTGLLAVDPDTGRVYFTGDKKKEGFYPEWTGDAVCDDNKRTTLTMKSSKSAWAWTCFRDSISVDWAPKGDYTFAVSNRNHTTTGSITVSRGTFISGTGNTFNSLSRLVVRDGATFVADPGYDYRTFGNQTALEIWGTGKVQLAKDETFASVRTNGVLLADGEYTAATATWLAPGSAGKVTVDSQYDTRKKWLNPENGNWTTAAMWSGNAAPAAGEDAFIEAPGTYTVTVDEQPAAVKTLTLGGQSTGTVTLDVAADAEVTTATTITALKGGVLKASAGTLTIKNDTNARFPIVQKGGTFEASGDAVVAISKSDGTRAPDTGFFGGNTVFKDNAVFSPKAGQIVTDSSNGDTLTEFIDNAVCGNEDLGDARPYGLRLGSSTGTTTLRLASDATHFPATIVYVGYNNYNGALKLENGTLKMANTSGGFRIAYWYYTPSVVKPVG